MSQASLERIDGYFDKDNDLKNRALIFLAWSEIGLGKLKAAERHISKAKAFFHKTGKKDTERNVGEYLADISIVEGDIAMHKKNYAKAVEKYKEAGENLKKVYRNLKNDFYGLILERLARASVLANKTAQKMQYLTEYEKIFGKQDERGLRMSLL